MDIVNRQLRLAARPEGEPQDDVWEVTEEAVADPGDGELVVENLYVSIDPAMRGWLDDRPSYLPPVGIGEVMRAGAVGRVIASRNPDHPVGEHLSGAFGVQRYALSNGAGAIRVDADLAPLPTWLGTLGMTGMTAYFGLLEIGAMKPGETVVVSAAAGAVGGAAGQIAHLRGAERVIGIAGGPEKCRYVVERLGFDAALDYRSDDIAAELRRLAPDGVDVYFDNVGGEILDAVLTRLARHARVPICGAVSQYNAKGPMRGPSNYMSLLVNRARMEGFLVFDFFDRFADAAREIGGWIRSGELVADEQVVEGGVDAFPEALRSLLRGDNTGKMVLEVGSEG